SRARRPSVSIGPLPSSGLPSGSTTRPRYPSPTGTDSTSPVRRTRCPSSILLKSPRITTPISRTSRFSAMPRVPSSNSRSSFAIVEGRPETWAMPSAASTTVPISSRAAPSGSYAWTKRSSASRISSGRIVSSAISVYVSLFASAGQPAADIFDSSGDRGVDEVVSDLDGEPTEHLRVHLDVQVNLSPVGGSQPRSEPLLLLLGERYGAAHDADQAFLESRDDPAVLVEGRFQATSSRMHHQLRDEPQGGAGDLPFEQLGQQRPLPVARDVRVAERPAQLGVGGEDPAEPEQLVFQVVDLAERLRLSGGGRHAEALQRVGKVTGAGPLRLHGGDGDLDRGVADLAVQQRPED